MIQCKRVYEQASPEDGYRVLVDRLWPRGVKKTDLMFDEWCKTLTPSSELRKAFHSDMIDFTAFSKAYQDELAQHQDEGLRLAQRANKQTVTLLYGAKDTEQNHALVLADWLRQL
ncbi:DUF488 domain-containing protein [Enterobacter cloacae complex sp. 2024EL-00215]|uniref:DUF488 domain-containing protein n=1 Tax=Enterobacter mori TaxID=539813 RepID=A0A7T0DZA0_9ENTR|nr:MULTISPECIES: DUF488 domain-containing protein [Enterobacter]MBA7853584.1 DUF488 domain-containing protein [Enterobacter sp. RHBSTW-00901]QPK02240.1 DUF488 domain-containing protein [Enterobacter mori]BBS37821.1 MarR family transcriptional regulator [Enterobacter cloacae]